MIVDYHSVFGAHVLILFQRYPTDKAYFIAKEILTTERTYLKDLEVITVVSVFVIVFDPDLLIFINNHVYIHVALCISPLFHCPLPIYGFQWFRSAVIKENAMPEGLMTLLFSNIDPIYEFHRGFLKELDQRLALW